ncbi:hypothetical protein N431DRAFT_459974 [Stipitochalara longipes BDJ]|nr:hypothetical protein N431DRAFT_459974 [Stipitochalara longipes BDJ]
MVENSDTPATYAQNDPETLQSSRTSNRRSSDGVDEQPTSYEGLAQLMGIYPELAIFRRFGALNLYNIIFMQAEIAALELQYREMVAKEKNSEEIFSSTWYMLRDTASHHQRGPSNDDPRNFATSQILRFEKPTATDLGFLQTWLTSAALGDNFLAPSESAAWQKESLRPDLVTLHPRSESDKKFSRRAMNYMVNLVRRAFRWKGMFGNEEIPGLVNYQATNLLLAVQITTAVLSSLLLLLSVVALYFVQPTGARLGIIGAFSVSFSLGLAVLSGANRNEIFAATAACIAVQVVFVGTN